MATHCETRKGISEEYLENLWKKTDINNVIVKKNKKSLIEKIKKIKHFLPKNKNA